MRKISTLYKIDDTVVFYSLENDYTLATLLANGTSFTDVFGNNITKEEAEFEYAVMTGQFRPRNKLERIYRNIELSSVIIAIVRKELLELTDGAMYLVKLQTAIAFAQVGMFNDASAFVLSLIPDDNLTDEQLTRWSNLLLSANAIEDV